MNCMKCGRETALGQVFCKECLAEMDKHPVKPGTPIVLPPQNTASTPRRTPTRKVRKPEEQVTLLRRLLLAVSLVLLAVSLAFAITVSVMSEQLQEKDNASLPGQNYSTEGSS